MEKRKVYLVPHTHYDAVWVFTKDDYFYINMDFILKKVVELLDTEPEYRFLVEQTYLLEEIERRRPELFQKLAKYIREGRIEIACGEYLMADTMLPQGETLVRQILVGKRYVKEKFGKDVLVMWQADSFGLNAQLPQIYKKAGYKYVAFRRGCTHRKPSEFIWKALDGTGIIAHWMPLGYRAGLKLDKLDDSYEKLKELAATNHILMPCGSGVTMPQPETIQAVREWNEKHSDAEMRVSTPSEFFQELEKHADALETKEGEMYSSKYSEVFPDCCSSRMWLKKSLRTQECKILAMEKFATLAYALGNSYPEELDECWKRLLFLAFHDVVPGTGMDDCYEEAKAHIRFLDRQFEHIMPKVLTSIVESIHSEENERPEEQLIVFNPLSWDVKNWVEAELKFDMGVTKNIGVLKDAEGKIYPVELLSCVRHDDGSLKKARIGFVADLPALGFKGYKIVEEVRGEGTQDIGHGLKVEGNFVENRFFKVHVSSETGILEVFKKDGSKVCSGNEIVLEEEVGDLYTHKDSNDSILKSESGTGIKYGAFRVKEVKVDASEVRAVITVESEYYSLRWPYRLTEKLKPLIWRHRFIELTKKIIVYRDIPRIDFFTIVKNRHPRVRMRVKFSTELGASNYTCETQFGAIVRPTNTYYLDTSDYVEKPSGVFPSLKWVDYNDGKQGLTIINKGIPENEVRDGSIYLTLLRSVAVLSSDGKYGPVIPVQDAMEFREYYFSYALYIHDGDWKTAESYKPAYEFNYEPIVRQHRSSKNLGEASFVKVSPNNIILEAMKQGEDKSSIVLRLYETAGKRSTATIELFKEVKDVQVTNLLEDENDSREVCVEGKTIKVNFKPFEILTLKVKL
jgi:alpha-mannosidase